MNCKIENKDIPACYLLPNMKEVRAEFLWYTKQHDRLDELRRKVYESGQRLNYNPYPYGLDRGWRIV